MHPGGATSGEIGKVWDPAQKGDYDEYLKTIALPQAREIIDRYNPAILWWNITAEIAATAPTKLSIRVGTATHTIDIPATGEGLTWKIIPHGTIELPAEEAILELKPVPGQWKPIHLGTLKLQP